MPTTTTPEESERERLKRILCPIIGLERELSGASERYYFNSNFLAPGELDRLADLIIAEKQAALSNAWRLAALLLRREGGRVEVPKKELEDFPSSFTIDTYEVPITDTVVWRLSQPTTKGEE